MSKIIQFVANLLPEHMKPYSELDYKDRQFYKRRSTLFMIYALLCEAIGHE